jgi:hypothetical protein
MKVFCDFIFFILQVYVIGDIFLLYVDDNDIIVYMDNLGI